MRRSARRPVGFKGRRPASTFSRDGALIGFLRWRAVEVFASLDDCPLATSALCRLSFSENPLCASFSFDGSWLFVGFASRLVAFLRDGGDFLERESFALSSEARGVCAGSNGVCAVGVESRILAIDFSNKPVVVLGEADLPSPVGVMTFSIDNRLLATCCELSRVVRVWHLRQFKMRCLMLTLPDVALSLEFKTSSPTALACQTLRMGCSLWEETSFEERLNFVEVLRFKNSSSVAWVSVEFEREGVEPLVVCDDETDELSFESGHQHYVDECELRLGHRVEHPSDVCKAFVGTSDRLLKINKSTKELTMVVLEGLNCRGTVRTREVSLNATCSENDILSTARAAFVLSICAPQRDFSVLLNAWPDDEARLATRAVLYDGEVAKVVSGKDTLVEIGFAHTSDAVSVQAVTDSVARVFDTDGVAVEWRVVPQCSSLVRVGDTKTNRNVQAAFESVARAALVGESKIVFLKANSDEEVGFLNSESPVVTMDFLTQSDLLFGCESGEVFVADVASTSGVSVTNASPFNLTQLTCSRDTLRVGLLDCGKVDVLVPLDSAKRFTHVRNVLRQTSSSEAVESICWVEDGVEVLGVLTRRTLELVQLGTDGLAKSFVRRIRFSTSSPLSKCARVGATNIVLFRDSALEVLCTASDDERADVKLVSHVDDLLDGRDKGRILKAFEACVEGKFGGLDDFSHGDDQSETASNLFSMVGASATTTPSSFKTTNSAKQLQRDLIDVEKTPQFSRYARNALLKLVEVFSRVYSTSDSLDDSALAFVTALERLRASSSSNTTATMSTNDVLWAMSSESKRHLLNRVSKEYDWRTLAGVGAGLWLVEDKSLSVEVALKCAQNEYLPKKDPFGITLLFYVACDRTKVASALVKSCNARCAELLSRDFSEERWKHAACKNAYALLSKRRFEDAVAFFILGDRLEDAVNVCIKSLKDYQLALMISVLKSKTGLRGCESAKRILTETVLPQAAAAKDPYLYSIGVSLMHYVNPVRAFDHLQTPPPSPPHELERSASRAHSSQFDPVDAIECFDPSFFDSDMRCSSESAKLSVSFSGGETEPESFSPKIHPEFCVRENELVELRICRLNLRSIDPDRCERILSLTCRRSGIAHALVSPGSVALTTLLKASKQQDDEFLYKMRKRCAVALLSPLARQSASAPAPDFETSVSKFVQKLETVARRAKVSTEDVKLRLAQLDDPRCRVFLKFGLFKRFPKNLPVQAEDVLDVGDVDACLAVYKEAAFLRQVSLGDLTEVEFVLAFRCCMSFESFKPVELLFEDRASIQWTNEPVGFTVSDSPWEELYCRDVLKMLCCKQASEWYPDNVHLTRMLAEAVSKLRNNAALGLRDFLDRLRSSERNRSLSGSEKLWSKLNGEGVVRTACFQALLSLGEASARKTPMLSTSVELYKHKKELLLDACVTGRFVVVASDRGIREIDVLSSLSYRERTSDGRVLLDKEKSDFNEAKLRFRDLHTREPVLNPLLNHSVASRKTRAEVFASSSACWKFKTSAPASPASRANASIRQNTSSLSLNSSSNNNFEYTRAEPTTRLCSRTGGVGHYFSGCHDGTVLLWEVDVEDSRAVYSRPSNTRKGWNSASHVTRVCSSNDGDRLAACESSGQLAVWKSDDQRPLVGLICHDKSANDAEFLGGGTTMLATCGLAHDHLNLALWDTLLPPRSCRVAALQCFGGSEHESGSGGGRALAYARDKQQILCGGGDGSMLVFDLRQRVVCQRLAPLKHKKPVASLSCSRSGEVVAAARVSGAVSVYALLSSSEWVEKSTISELHPTHTFVNQSSAHSLISQYGATSVCFFEDTGLISAGSDGVCRMTRLSNNEM